MFLNYGNSADFITFADLYCKSTNQFNENGPFNEV